MTIPNMSENIIDVLLTLYDKGQCPLTELGEQQCAAIARKKDTLMRALLARSLICAAPKSEAAAILCKLAIDKNALVRTEAIDSLCEFPEEQVYNVFLKALLDPKPIVRSYAADGIALVGKTLGKTLETKSVLFTHLSTEKQITAKIGYYKGLYILGEQNALNELIACFRSKQYKNQCAVLNSLDDILNNENAEQILHFLQSIRFFEYPASVSSTGNRLMQKIQGMVSNK